MTKINAPYFPKTVNWKYNSQKGTLMPSVLFNPITDGMNGVYRKYIPPTKEDNKFHMPKFPIIPTYMWVPCLLECGVCADFVGYSGVTDIATQVFSFPHTREVFTNQIAKSVDGVFWQTVQADFIPVSPPIIPAPIVVMENSTKAFLITAEAGGGGSPSDGSTFRWRTSTDGISWVTHEQPVATVIYPIYGEINIRFFPYRMCAAPELGIVIAPNFCSEPGSVYWTDDGEHWNCESPPAVQSGYLQGGDICWSPELRLFVWSLHTAAYPSGSVVVSSDGKVWEVAGDPLMGDLHTICWSPKLGLFTAFRGSTYGTTIGKCYTSSNGKDWTEHSSILPANNGGGDIAWSPECGNFTAVVVDSSGDHTKILRSYDGMTWSECGTMFGVSRSICWFRDIARFVAVFNDGSIVLI